MENIFRLDDMPDMTSYDGVVFDTNVWVYILYPAMCYGRPGTKQYTDMFDEMKKSGIPINLDIVIYQELLNFIIKDAYKNYCECSDKGFSISFKNYRKTKHFEENVHQLSELLHKNVFPNVTCISPYTVESFDRLLQSNYKMNTNDAHITKFCKDNHCLLVTHDADFIGEDIDIATANQKFFSG